MISSAHPASFRDPSGYILRDGERLLRIVNPSFSMDFDAFNQSGLYAELSAGGLIVKTTDITQDARTLDANAYKILVPEQIDFISYPYEWCFPQLREAALLTLRLHKTALAHGMALKDASAFNIQFQRGRAVHIDTLSFERYAEGTPWKAYRQFCRHFLAPLALMALRDVHCARLLANSHDGIALDMAANLLGMAWLKKPSLYPHILLQAKLDAQPAGTTKNTARRMTKQVQILVIEHLEKLVASLPSPARASHWSGYAQEVPYSDTEHALKRDTIAAYCNRLQPKTIWDMGANSGEFSRIAADCGARVIALEGDHASTCAIYEANYAGIVPLWMDLLCPSPAGGWAHSEQQSLAERGRADMLFCLALGHHLAIAGNVPFARQADYFATLCDHAAVEFISPQDPNAARMLSQQPELKSHYTQDAFDAAFAAHFSVVDTQVIIPGKRTLTLFKRKGS